jgi:nucleotide-binding universal stress UspA family protein
MYQRIVVGTDGSDRANAAVDHAAALARLCGAELHLVQGCGSPIVMTAGYVDAIALNPNELVEGGLAALEPVADRLRGDGTDVQVHVRAESGHVALCNTAEDIDADLIVVGNRGMTGARRFLGSVPNSVAHQAPCSVLIVATD